MGDCTPGPVWCSYGSVHDGCSHNDRGVRATERPEALCATSFVSIWGRRCKLQPGAPAVAHHSLPTQHSGMFYYSPPLLSTYQRHYVSTVHVIFKYCLGLVQ